MLEIKIIGNRKKAIKDVQCFSFEQIIDSDLTNYKDLVESIVEKYPPGYLEVAHVQYYDSDLQTYPKVKSNQGLMDMFEKHSMSMIVQMFIVYYDPIDTKISHRRTGRLSHSTYARTGEICFAPMDRTQRCACGALGAPENLICN